MNLIQYFKHIFDFRRRASEQQKFKERKDQIDTFYDDLYKVEHKIAKKMEEKSSGFDQFDWKERVGQIGSKTVNGVKCWNCNKVNDDDAYFCQSCSAPLKKQE